MIVFVCALQVLLLGAMLLSSLRGPSAHVHALVIGFAAAVAVLGLVGSFVIWPDVSTIPSIFMGVLSVPAVVIIFLMTVDRIFNGPLLDDSVR